VDSDEDVSSRIHSAIVEGEEKSSRIRIAIEGIGLAYITKKRRPNRDLNEGEKLEVMISHHAPTDRWLVSKIISIDGEPYSSPETVSKKEKAKVENKQKKKASKKEIGLSEKEKKKKYWENNIAKQVSFYTKISKNNVLEYWKENIKFSVNNYPINPMTTIEDDERFEGYFISTPVWTDGWQGHVWCEELDSLVYVNYSHGRESGSFVLGAKVSFTVIVVYDNLGASSFKANQWSSNRTRTLPEPAFSISHKNFEEEHDKITKYLDSKAGPVVVVALCSLGNKKERLKDKSLNGVMNDVKSHFPNHEIIQFNPFDSSRHPLLKEMSYGSVVILPIKNERGVSDEQLSSLTVVKLKEICQEHDLKKSGLKRQIIDRILEKLSSKIQLSESDEERCIIGMTHIIHKQQITNRKGWMILGDETGRFREFEGESDARKSRMLWVVVPPDCDLPLLHPNFHGSDMELFSGDLQQALTVLSIHSDKVKTFIFSHEEGEIPNSVKNIKNVNKGHLMMWQLTLPLVMEYVISQAKSEDSVSIYIERLDHDGLSPGSRPLATMIQEFADSYERRSKSKKVSFSDTRILAKHPIEHGWLAYTDALGHLFNETMPEEMIQAIEQLKRTAYSVPYRQKSLNLTVRTALKNLASSLVFLKSISNISSEDIRDYIRPFLTEAIVEARDSLNNGEWQELLQHFKNTAETIEGQHAASLILTNIDIDYRVDRFHNEMEKYIFLKSVLGSSNHVGTTKVANRCKVYIDGLLDGGLKLSKRERRKLKTLQAGANDNQFDWAHIINFEEIAEEIIEGDAIDWDEDTQAYFGSQAISRALRNEPIDLDEALEVEAELRSIHHRPWGFRRRFCYYSELLMMKSEFEEAKRVLEIEFPERIGEPDNQLHLADRYYLASLLKSCALSSSTEFFQDYSKFVLKSLNEKHPSQRIAYWYCRWAHEIAQTENEVFESCLLHLLSLKNYDFFNKEAPGVILACELIDLNKRGLIEDEHESFLEDVLQNSEIFAKEWVASNPPSEDDWLAPLNFNYR